MVRSLNGMPRALSRERPASQGGQALPEYSTTGYFPVTCRNSYGSTALFMPVEGEDGDVELALAMGAAPVVAGLSENVTVPSGATMR